ncbi:hypothetical protein LXL04_020180 [Taraxacum kok-saghyz]
MLWRTLGQSMIETALETSSDRVRIVPQSNARKRTFTVVGTVDSKTRITAELGGGFTADPPKWIADIDVPASVGTAVGVTRTIGLSGHGDDEGEGENEEIEGKCVETFKDL